MMRPAQIRYSLCLFLLTFFFSCSSKSQDQGLDNVTPVEKVSAIQPTSARFELTDSIMIDVLGGFTVYDYLPEKQLFLAGDIAWAMGPIAFTRPGASYKTSNTLGHLLIDREGQIVSQIKNFGDGPEAFGPAGLEHFFMGDSSLAVLGLKGLFQYDFEGRLIRKYRDINSLDYISYQLHTTAATNSSGMLAIGMTNGKTAAVNHWDSIYQIIKPLKFYDLSLLHTENQPSDRALVAAHAYPEHHVYAPNGPYLPDKNGFSSGNDIESPPYVSYNSFRNEAYAVYPLIAEMEVFDMQTGTRKGRVSLNPDHFTAFEALGSFSGGPKAPAHWKGGTKRVEQLAWRNRGGEMASSRYCQVVQIGAYTLMRYNVALPEDEIESLVATDFKKNPRWPAIRRRHYRFYYQLFKDGQKVLPDFEFPALEPKEGQKEFMSTFATRGTIVGGNGLDEIFVHMPNDGEEERDYERIYVYKLILE